MSIHCFCYYFQCPSSYLLEHLLHCPDQCGCAGSTAHDLHSEDVLGVHAAACQRLRDTQKVHKCILVEARDTVSAAHDLDSKDVLGVHTTARQGLHNTGRGCVLVSC